MLTQQQHESFESDGFVRISAFSKDDASAMEELVWGGLNRLHGIVRDEPATWTVMHPSGLQPLKAHKVFAPIGSPVLIEAIDDLMGAGQWEKPKHWGQFLVTFPQSNGTWNVPCQVWHTDYDFLPPPGRVSGLLVFSFLSSVPPQSGGTAVVAGSHRMIREYVNTRQSRNLKRMKKVRRDLLASDPWLKKLSSDDDAPDRIEQFMMKETTVSGVPLRVKELTGKPGEIILGHPWLLHSGSPNCGQYPRIMRVQRLSGNRN